MMKKLFAFSIILFLFSILNASAQVVEGTIISIEGKNVIVDLTDSQLAIDDILEVYEPPKTIKHPTTGEDIPLEESLIGKLKITAVKDKYSNAVVEDIENPEALRVGQIIRLEEKVYFEMPTLTYKRRNLYANGVKITKKNANDYLIDSDLYFKWRKAKKMKGWADATSWLLPLYPVFCVAKAGVLGVPGIPGSIGFLNSKRRMKNILNEYNSRDYSKVDIAYIEKQNQLKEQEFERRRIRDERFAAGIDAFSQSLNQMSITMAQINAIKRNNYVPQDNGGGGIPTGNSGGNNPQKYFVIYQKWEKMAKSNYESLMGMSTGTFATFGFQRNLKLAQQNMRSTRNDAARNGVNIPQSVYETVRTR